MTSLLKQSFGLTFSLLFSLLEIFVYIANRKILVKSILRFYISPEDPSDVVFIIEFL